MSYRASPRARRLADRHYSRRTVGATQFASPGRIIVLVTEPADAVWVSLWQHDEFTDHAWPGAWVCSLFRNEGPVRSSELVAEAVAATRAVWGAPRAHGFITFVDPAQVRSTNPGYCYLRAGWERLDERTKGGHIVLRQALEAMPPPSPALGAQAALWEASR